MGLNLELNDKIVLFVTCSSVDEGESISSALVKSRLVACVNIIDSVKSIFFWNGNLDTEQEVLLVCKSVHGLLDGIIAKVKSLHSYDCPEVIALPIVGGSAEYLAWIDESVALESGSPDN